MASDDQFGHHEALHGVHMMASMWEDHIMGHLAVDSNPVLKQDAKKIQELLGAFYRSLSCEMDYLFSPEEAIRVEAVKTERASGYFKGDQGFLERKETKDGKAMVHVRLDAGLRIGPTAETNWKILSRKEGSE